MASLWEALKQYVGDSLPGGALNPEVSARGTIGGLLSTAAAPLQAAAKNKTVKALLDWSADNQKQAEDAFNAQRLTLGGQPYTSKDVGDAMMYAGVAPVGMIAYRGISGKYNPSYKQPVEWWSHDKNLAKGYGQNVIESDISPTSTVDLGFRDYRTEVKKDDVLDRVYRAIADRFNSKALDKNSAMSLVDDVENLRGGDTFKQAHQWINTPEIANILKQAGYDSISHVENGVQTYGLLR